MTSRRWRRLCAVLVLGALAGCAGTTSIQRSNPFIAGSAAADAAKVYFIRPDPGFNGVMDFPLTISLGGTGLMKLAKGTYTLLPLKAGSTDMKMEYYTVVGPSNLMTSASTTARLSFAAGATQYLLFEQVSRGGLSGSAFVPHQVSRGEALDAAQGLLPVGGAIADPLVK